MRKAPAFTVIFTIVFCAGCVLPGKSAKQPPPTPAAPVAVVKPAPQPPPEPLSIPQTQVQLPQPQPVPEAALEMAPVETAPEPSTSGSRPPARRSPAVGANPAPAPVSAPPPAVTPPTAPEAVGPAITEVITPTEAKHLQDQAINRRRIVEEDLKQIRARHLTPAQQNVIASIDGFIASSADAEKKGDMRLADALAERAQNLAKDLLNAK